MVMCEKMVSCIITTYERKVTILKRAIMSIVNQTYSNIEIIIVNDSPENKALSNEIEALIKRIQKNCNKKIFYISYKKNMGANYARNYGVHFSNGDYIAFLDDDDEWLPFKIEKQVNLMKKEENISIVYSNFYIDEDGNRKIKNLIKVNNDIRLNQILIQNFIGSTSFPLIDKKAFLLVGGFDENLRSCQEYELYIRLLEKNNIAFSQEPVGVYYISKNSTFRNNFKKYYNSLIYIFNKHKELFTNYLKEFNLNLNNSAFYFLINKQIKYYFNLKWKAIRIKCFSIDNFTIVLLLKRIINKKIKYNRGEL